MISLQESHVAGLGLELPTVGSADGTSLALQLSILINYDIFNFNENLCIWQRKGNVNFFSKYKTDSGNTQTDYSKMFGQYRNDCKFSDRRV